MPLPQRRYRNVYERIDQVIISFLVFNFIIITHGINRSYVPELGLFLNFINCFKGITAFILREKNLIRLFLTQKNNWFILVNVNSRPKLITLLDILPLNIWANKILFPDKGVAYWYKLSMVYLYYYQKSGKNYDLHYCFICWK